MLALSSIWFQEQLASLEAGARRLAELNTLPWRFPGKRGPTKRPAPAPPGIRALAVTAVAFSARATRKRADRELLYRAARGEQLRQWELRRVEYLAVKATRKVGGADTGRQSEPAAEDFRGGVSAAAVCRVLVMSPHRQEARDGDACQFNNEEERS